MNVAIDTSAMYSSRAGVARFVQGLLYGLHSGFPADLKISPIAWEVENFQYRWPERQLKTIYRELVWARLLAPGILKRANAEVYHSTGSALFLPPKGVRYVATLHDLATVRFPGRFRRWQLISSKNRLKRILEADKLVCISRFTADEAIKLIGADSRRIEVVHHGCDFVSENRIPIELDVPASVPDEFYLFVGSLEPGKNLSLLREAYLLADSQGIVLPPLVIVGARWLGVPNEGEPPANWHYLGRQPDGVLVSLYKRAVALVFPSVYEGFGLPLIEAMALRCPVICSRIASLPEVGGDAPLYADLSPEGYLEAMKRVSSDLVFRRELMERGWARASEFTWERCAGQYASIYRELA